VVHELELEIIPKMGEKTYLISKNIKRRSKEAEKEA
jgi:hypothetical protein